MEITLVWKWIHKVIQWELNPENMQPYKKEKTYIYNIIICIYIYIAGPFQFRFCMRFTLAPFFLALDAVRQLPLLLCCRVSWSYVLLQRPS